MSQTTNAPGRVRGSCRFEPYLKAQTWDDKAMAWKDIQKAVGSEAEAAGLVKAGQKYRIVTVTESGRTFGEPLMKGGAS